MNTSRILLSLLGIGMGAGLCAAQPPILLTVKVQGDGIVTSKPVGIHCPPSCAGSYEQSSTIVLTAIPDINSRFLGWEGACVDTEPTCEVELTSPSFAMAVFETAIADNPAIRPMTDRTVSWSAYHYDGAGQ